MIGMIVTLTEDGVVASKEQGTPWNPIVEELQEMVQRTKGANIIVGRKTFEDMGEVPMLDRYTIILTRKKRYLPRKYQRIATTCETAEEILNLCEARKGDTYILGGRKTYHTMIMAIDKIFVTRLKGSYTGTYFPVRTLKSLFTLESESEEFSNATDTWVRQVYTRNR